ncbi:cytochrome c-type biogenesis protein CcmH [Denitratisoma sp. DHT3]|uniref:cytochrome c-type biogenesis protein n=1 Tax=Denitratisoma sp. DHT3 TaxID=1981880 RepID=UPI001C9376BC|nr:cytochrome c-type biogenesis protein [Denitratisoma sp. DHT3]
MRKFILLAGLLLCTGLAAPVLAKEAAPAAEDQALEARVHAIAEDLRCLVCQNQNLADSHAELAIDLKNEIREMFRKGMTEQQVTDFLVQRYGDFVLYRPPVKSNTWLLWIGPFLLLAGGLGVLFVKLRKRRQQVAAPLSVEERAAAERLLDSNGKEGA